MAGGVVVATASAEMDASVDSTTSGGKAASSFFSPWSWAGESAWCESLELAIESECLVSVAAVESSFSSASKAGSKVSTGSFAFASPPDPKTSPQRELMTSVAVQRTMTKGALDVSQKVGVEQPAPRSKKLPYDPILTHVSVASYTMRP